MDFHAEVTDGAEGAIVLIRMTSRIVRESDARVVASQSFSTRAVAASTDTADVVAAFDEASDQLLIAFADWTFATLGRRLTAA